VAFQRGSFPRPIPSACRQRQRESTAAGVGGGYPVSTTTAEDRERFFGQSAGARVHVIEADWRGRMRECRLYAYRLPCGPFRPHEVAGGYWVADEQVDAVDQVILDDLADRHAAAGIELRVTPSIWPFWRRATNSTVAFSGSRLRNSAPHPERFDLRRGKG
jgi:hypothetical protein